MAAAGNGHAFTKEQLAEYKEQFDAFDEDGSGSIEVCDMRHAACDIAACETSRAGEAGRSVVMVLPNVLTSQYTAVVQSTQRCTLFPVRSAATLHPTHRTPHTTHATAACNCELNSAAS
jgi:hypothetical protein